MEGYKILLFFNIHILWLMIKLIPVINYTEFNIIFFYWNYKEGLNEKLVTFGQVSVPQAMADMAYNGEKCHINHSIIYNELYKYIRIKLNIRILDSDYKTKQRKTINNMCRLHNNLFSDFEAASSTSTGLANSEMLDHSFVHEHANDPLR